MKDYYKILELEKSATLSDIKKSYRRLSKILHPDKETGSKEKFQELNGAYQTLSDPAKKQAYDSGVTYQTPSRPIINNINVRINWTLSDIKKGKTVSVKLTRAVVCKTCNGAGSKNASSITVCVSCNGNGKIHKAEKTPFGYMQVEYICNSCKGKGEINTDPCPTCKGEKVVTENKTETIIIPPNVIFPFLIKDKGHNTIWGNSDLIIHFNFQSSENIAFFNDFFLKEVNVNFFDALLGKEQLIKFGDATLKVNLPKEAKTDQRFRLPKAYCGIDVLILIKVDFPSISETKEYILNIFKEDVEILPSITKHINEQLK